MSVLRGAWTPVAVTGLGVARFGAGVLLGAVLVTVLLGLLVAVRTLAVRPGAGHGRHRARP